MRTDRRTDVTMLKVAFRNFAKGGLRIERIVQKIHVHSFKVFLATLTDRKRHVAWFCSNTP